MHTRRTGREGEEVVVHVQCKLEVYKYIHLYKRNNYYTSDILARLFRYDFLEGGNVLAMHLSQRT